MKGKQIELRKTQFPDLETLFQIQLNEEANHLAAFTSGDPFNKAAYIEKYTRHMADPEINMLSIWVGDKIVGSIAKFEIGGDAEITYWIDRSYWGQGIATTALRYLLTIESKRPIFGRTAFDNPGSQQVLEKCGFVKIGTDRGFAKARQAEIEEFIYKLS